MVAAQRIITDTCIDLLATLHNYGPVNEILELNSLSINEDYGESVHDYGLARAFAAHKHKVWM